MITYPINREMKPLFSDKITILDGDIKNGGAYRLFPASDFFSDRAVKVVSEIRLIRN
jgi:hypothetical protein